MSGVSYGHICQERFELPHHAHVFEYALVAGEYFCLYSRAIVGVKGEAHGYLNVLFGVAATQSIRSIRL